MTNPTPHGQVPEALRAAPNTSYSPEDRAFHQFWYGHMLEDLMQPPLIGISHSTARYIWDSALRTQQPASPTPPAEQPIGELVVTKTRDGEIVSVTRQDDEGRILSVIATSDSAEQQAAPKAAPGEPFDECFPGEPRVAVPQGLISAACFAIRNKRDGGKVLEQLRRYSVGDLSQPLAPQQKAHHLTQALTDQENQPNQYGVEFGMSGQQMHFKIGNQLFRLAYEPDDQQEFEFMKRMLIHAFSTFTPDVKAAPQQEAQEPTEVPYQKLTNEIDLILSDTDAELSIGAKRALLWMRTWVSVPLFTAPQPAPAPLSDALGPLKAWWAMQEAQWELCEETPSDDDAILHFMGSGASMMVTAGQMRAALAAQGGK